ncbi:unnamed protein product [Fraxinus pennsylvanica]|uniref:Uncharacterized protein n=1 Tax=Fraxinus pennsylvanica TaxID=56036 RepID=A0AAD2DR77_9LAMI|nr:unnamed protein product [Fraxinus pennsylvanica]
MDYSLTALKFAVTLEKRRGSKPLLSAAFSSNTPMYIFFDDSAELRGVLVSTLSSSGGGCFLLDDGTCIIELLLSGDFGSRNWETGMYVTVIGVHFVHGGDNSVVKVHKMVDLSPFPERESVVP